MQASRHLFGNYLQDYRASMMYFTGLLQGFFPSFTGYLQGFVPVLQDIYRFNKVRNHWLEQCVQVRSPKKKVPLRDQKGTTFSEKGD